MLDVEVPRDAAPAARSLLLPEMRVDPEWYILRHAALVQALPRLTPAALEQHFRQRGDGLGADPNPWFLLSHYIVTSRYAERAPTHAPAEDYIRHAGPARWTPHWLFDEARYQRLHPKVADAVQKRNIVSGYVHFLRRGQGEGLSPHVLFNAAHYREAARLPPEADAWLHFLRIGQFDGLSPHPLFDAEHYLQAGALVDATGRDKPFTSALHHFVQRGIRGAVAPIPDFEPDFYLAKYPDVAEWLAAQPGRSAFAHFLEHGQQEGRQPNPYFSAADYAWYNPGVEAEARAAGLDSLFAHFLAHGARRGLRAHRPAHTVAVPELHAKAIFEQRARIASQLALHEGLALPEHDAPDVSFVLPVRDNVTFTLSLLGQLEREARAAPAVPMEVILVDNGSRDETRELGQSIPGLRVLRSEAATGYTIACNRGAAMARGAILVFLNNDIEVTPGLLPRIRRSLAGPDVAVSGARIVNAAGQLQEAGSLLWRDGSAAGLGRGRDPTLPAFLAPRDVDYVSGCLLCIRREVFEELGGFDEAFSPGYYEDTDLCLRVRASGRRVVYDPTLVIYHYEYASYSKGRPPSSSAALMARNRRAFVEKNRALLAALPGPAETTPMRAAFAGTAARALRVLLIEDRLPAAAAGSGFTRSADVLAAMTRAGMLVKVWSLHERAAAELPHWARGAWSVLPRIDGPQTVAELLRQRGDEFDLVWVCRTHNFRALRAPLLQWREARTGRRVVADTEAVAALRPAAVMQRAATPLPEAEILAAIRGEAPELGSADAIVAVNRRDADWLGRAFARSPVVLGHRFDVTPGEAPFAARSGLLFLGAIYGADSPNQISIAWLIDEVFPRLAERLPGVRLSIAGRQDPAVPPPSAATADDRIALLGEVAALGPLFDAHRVFVAPTLYAGGLPHKVENAAAHGLPVVATPLLAEQLRRPGEPDFVVQPEDATPEAFAAAVARLYTDQALWEACRAQGLRHVAAACDPARFDAEVVRIAHG